MENIKTKIIFLVLMCLALILDQVLVTSLLPILPHIVRQNWIDSTNCSENISVLNCPPYNDNSTFNKNSNHSVSQVLGIIFAFRGLAQMVCNPLVGVLIDYTFPLLSIGIGVVADGSSLLFFAFSNDVVALSVSRCFQGLGAAAILTGCFAGIAEIFKSIGGRRRATALANISTFFGSAVGPFLGGFMYQFSGRYATFLSPFAIIIITLLLMLMLYPLCKPKCNTFQPKAHKTVIYESAEQDTLNCENGAISDVASNHSDVKIKYERPTPIYRLLFDPYVFLATIGLFIANISQNAWFPTLPEWMAETFSSSDWEQGIIWAPSIFFYILGVVASTGLSQRLPRYTYIITAFAFLIGAASVISIPFVTHWIICFVNIGMALFANAMIEITLMPMLTTIVDRRYTEIYGSISSFPPTAFSLAVMFGSFIGGTLTEKLGFMNMNLIIGSFYILYSPFLIFLRKFC